MTETEIKQLVVKNVADVLLHRGIPAVPAGTTLKVKGVEVTYCFYPKQKDKHASRNAGVWYVKIEFNRKSFKGRPITLFEIKSKHRQRKDGTFAYDNIADNLVRIADYEIASKTQRDQENANRAQMEINSEKVAEFRKQYPNLPESVRLKETAIELAPIRLGFDFGSLTVFQAHAIMAVLREVGLLGKKEEEQ